MRTVPAIVRPPFIVEMLGPPPLREWPIIKAGPRPPDLARLRFRVETNPVGPAVDLVWELADPAAGPDAAGLLVRRRVRRFPGRARRGVVPVAGTTADTTDGQQVHLDGTLEWDLEETTEELTAEGRVRTTRHYLYRGTPRDRVLVRTIRRELPRAGGPPRRTTVRVVDRAGLAAGTIYYYTAFVGRHRWYSRRTQSSAIATGAGAPDLFALLPRIDQERDTEPPEPFSVPRSEHGRGQLERLLRTTQVHADMLGGFVDGLRDVHDLRRADSRLLGPAAGMIGWRLKEYLDEEGQRAELAMAPHVYRSLGSAPAIAAMLNRLTGWRAEARDFARSVVLTWDPSRVERIGAVTAYLDGGARVEGDPPALVAGGAPRGTVDTGDAVAMQRLRDRDPADLTAHSYDCGRFDPGAAAYRQDDRTWYNRETLGIYVRPPSGATAAALRAAWPRVRAILAEFLPIQVRTILFVRPAA